MACEKIIFGICFVAPASEVGSSIFGFAEFISALALLVIVYTVSEIRYRFRIAVAPPSLYKETYLLIGIIGFGTLLTDVWLTQGWLVPGSYISESIWRGMFAFFFLFIVMRWMYYAFINPPIFSEKNYRKFAQKLFRVILKGADTDLSIIASELQKSAESLVKYSRQNKPRWPIKGITKEEKTKRTPNVGDYAYDLLLLIGNKKLCRNIMTSSPATAIAFFEAMADNKKYELPIGQFARNISTEAILNKDSILYHEDDGYTSGLIGYLKPFSQAIYGNYWLVEALASNAGSPLDIDYRIVSSWDASQHKVYSKVVIITLKSYMKSGSWTRHSYSLHQAFINIGQAYRDVYKLNDINSDYYSTDTYARLVDAVAFVKEAIDLIETYHPSTKLRVRDERRYVRNLYDDIADMMFEIILCASSVKTQPDKCWDIHYCTVWGEFFGLSGNGKAWEVVHFKLSRLLYDEILRLDEFPNFKSSRILGFCLNVLGFKLGDKKSYRRDEYALHKVVLAWTRKNYLRLKSTHSTVAESCLFGSISFDKTADRLVKTYSKRLNIEAPKDYLELRSTGGTEEQ